MEKSFRISFDRKKIRKFSFVLTFFASFIFAKFQEKVFSRNVSFAANTTIEALDVRSGGSDNSFLFHAIYHYFCPSAAELLWNKGQIKKTEKCQCI